MSKFHLILYLSVGLTAISQVWLKRCAMTKPASSLFDFRIYAAYTILCVALLLNIYGLRHVPLTDMAVILPAIFIIIPVLSYFFLNERQSARSWLGVILVCIGTAVYSL
jgi:drug/metabolite transporter (DMT)-like permease